MIKYTEKYNLQSYVIIFIRLASSVVSVLVVTNYKN